MQRIIQTPRQNWQSKLLEQGFHFHSIDDEGNNLAGKTDKFLYWRDDVAYKFTEEQVETLYEATKELHFMSMSLISDLIKAGDLSRLHIPEKAQNLITNSFNISEPHLYGRFDLSWNGEGAPKMLEYNADTPTSIIESSIAQWFWKEDVYPQFDQYNSLHEAFIERWKFIKNFYDLKSIHMGCMFESQEDVGNIEYMMECALQAGLEAKILNIPEIGIDAQGNYLDEKDFTIESMFKLYPWEFFFQEEFFDYFTKNNTKWIEPIWKAALSNKAILPLLWEKFPNHPNILPAFFTPEEFTKGNYVKKPILSREGANISIFRNHVEFNVTPGSYTDSGYIYQAYSPLPAFESPETTAWLKSDVVYPVIGSWVVGDEPAGICIREDISSITKNTSYFVPHYFVS